MLHVMTPEELADGYIAAIDDELATVARKLEEHRLEFFVLEDQQTLLRRLRKQHTTACAIARPHTPPSLAELIAEPEATTT